MAAEDALVRLGAVETALAASRNEVHQMMASHQAAHAEISQLRGQLADVQREAAAAMAAAARGGSGRPPRLVGDKAMMPDIFGDVKTGPQWRTWAFKLADYAVAVSGVPGLRQVLKAIGNRTSPVTAQDVASSGITADLDMQLAHLLVSRTTGNALEIVRGAYDEPGLEQWRLLSNTFDPHTQIRDLAEMQSVMSPAPAKTLEELPHVVQRWENAYQRHHERTGESLGAKMRLGVLISLCPREVRTEIEYQNHLFPDYLSLKSHLFTIAHNRAKGPAPMQLGSMEADEGHESLEGQPEEETELCALVKQSDGQRRWMPVRRSPKGTGKGKGTEGPDKSKRECFRCGRVGHERRDCRASRHVNGGAVKPHPRDKPAGNLEEESGDGDAEVGLLEINSFDVERLDADSAGDETVPREPTDLLRDHDPWAIVEAREVGLRKGPLGCRFGCTQCWKMGVYNGIQEQRDATATWSHSTPSPPPEPASSGGLRDPLLKKAALQSLGLELGAARGREILEDDSELDESDAQASPRGGKPGEEVKELAVLEESHSGNFSEDDFLSIIDDAEEDHIIELNTIELNDFAANDGDVEMFDEVTVDSGAGNSVINPKLLPGDKVKPSAGSRRGQHYVGPGGERIPNLGEFQVQLETAREGARPLRSQVTFQAANVRKPLLAVSGITEKKNMVVFDDSGSFILCGTDAEMAAIRSLVKGVRAKIPLQKKNGVYVMRARRAPKRNESAVFSRPDSQ